MILGRLSVKLEEERRKNNILVSGLEDERNDR
jgi:hypothetical protein